METIVKIIHEINLCPIAHDIEKERLKNNIANIRVVIKFVNAGTHLSILDQFQKVKYKGIIPIATGIFIEGGIVVNPSNITIKFSKKGKIVGINIERADSLNRDTNSTFFLALSRFLIK